MSCSPSDPDEDRRQIAEAVRGREAAPTSSCSRSAATSRRRAKRGTCKHMGDRTSLELIGRQNELVDAMVGAREAGRRAAVQRPSAVDHASDRASAGDSRVLVPRAGDRHRRGRGAVRRHDAGRQAADHDSAIGRSSAGVLQPQAVGASRLSVRRRLAALSVRLWVELHDVRRLERSARPRRSIARDGSTLRARGRHEHRDARRQRSRADVHPRPRQLGDAAGEGVAGFKKVSLAPGETTTVSAGDHARVARVLRRRHAVRRGAGRVRHHGRHVVARRRSARRSR